MQGEARRVLILYDHPLLGEGLERLLRDRPNLQVQLVHVDSLDAALTAIETHPDVVILERCPRVAAVDLLRFAPDTVFIDVGLDAGPSWTYRREELSPVPEAILRAISGRPRPVPRPAGR